MNGSSFQQDLRQIWIGFCFKLENGFILKRTERVQVLLKRGTRDFQNSPPFERLACFYVTITENFKRFQYFNFETDFLLNGNLFQKTGVPFLVESTKIENASFPYKTAILEANVKTNKTVTTKWTSQKERSFASNYLIFLKILFQFKNKELICCTNHPKNKNKS